MHSGYSIGWHRSSPLTAATLKWPSSRRKDIAPSTCSTSHAKARSFLKNWSRSSRSTSIERWRLLFEYIPLLCELCKEGNVRRASISDDVAFTGANVVSLFDRQDKDTAIPDLAG